MTEETLPGRLDLIHGRHQSGGAARLALRGTGEHRVSLNQAIEAMIRTGREMREEYRETSRGRGLAVRFCSAEEDLYEESQ